MNQLTHLHPAFGSSALPATPRPAAADTLQARFAMRITAGLTERAADLGPDLTERLRFAREQALARARTARAPEAAPRADASRHGASFIRKINSGWWVKLASVIPVIALAGGLVLIQRWQDDAQISVAADVDAALLADTLPPTAYSDAGFAEFLKAPNE